MMEVGRQGPAVKVGKEVGATRFEPTSRFDPEPQPDGNPLTNSYQAAVVEDPPSTDSTSKPRPDDIQTHNSYATIMPIADDAALSRSVAARPYLPMEVQQHILSIVHARDAPPEGEKIQVSVESD